MKRLSLEELKAKKNVVIQLESVKGGNSVVCHCGEPDSPCELKK
jgi:hypothetical protein